MRRPLIVTDKGVIAAGLWAKVKEQLARQHADHDL